MVLNVIRSVSSSYLCFNVVEYSKEAPVLFGARYVTKEVCSLDLTLPELGWEFQSYL